MAEQTQENSAQHPQVRVDCALGSYVATCTVTTQISDFEYEARIACHVINEQTTLADIIAWYRRYHKYGLQIRIVDAT